MQAPQIVAGTPDPDVRRANDEEAKPCLVEMTVAAAPGEGYIRSVKRTGSGKSAAATRILSPMAATSQGA